MEHATMPPLPTMVNFLILAVGLVLLVRKPMVEALKSRHEKWKSDIDEAEALRVKTEALFANCEQKMKSLQDEVSAIFETARKAAEKEKAEILAAAKIQAEKVVEDAKRLAESEKEFMQKKLRKEMLAQAIEKAKAELKTSVGSEEHQNFLKNFVDGVKVTHG